MQRLVTMLQQAEEYVGTVVDGKLPADPHMGRKVGNALFGCSCANISLYHYIIVCIATRAYFVSVFLVGVLIEPVFCRRRRWFARLTPGCLSNPPPVCM